MAGGAQMRLLAAEDWRTDRNARSSKAWRPTDAIGLQISGLKRSGLFDDDLVVAFAYPQLRRIDSGILAWRCFLLRHDLGRRGGGRAR